MQERQLSRRKRTFRAISFSVALFCLMLLFSSCANLSASSASPSGSAPTSAVPTPTARPLALKGDSNGIPSEAVLRGQLAKVFQAMAKMSLEQKLGQMIIVEYIGTNYQDTGLQYMVAQQYVGGYMYQESNHNFDSPYTLASNVNALSQQAMKDAAIPLLIATDQEGGLVNRLYKFHGYLPSAADMVATGDPNVALTQGTQAAVWMRELGINTDFAPVVDVHTVDPPILESRMFGSDPNTVVTYAGAYLTGLQKNGVAACLKHFPGLGAVNSDPHAGLPVVNRSKTDLEKIDLAPYRLMIQKYHPAMIMSTDVLMPAIDPSLPAELSPEAITGVLRNELGYNGVVITDGLYMAGISEKWSLSQAAVLSIVAGNDIVEGPYTPQLVSKVVQAFKQALGEGTLTMQRVNQAVERILLMKAQYGLL
jgi:beta-N-acetylhexosaminidase